MLLNNRFLYDLKATQSNESGKFHGGGKYARKVFFELIKTNSYWKIFALYDSTKELDEDISNVCNSNNITLLDINSGPIQHLITINGITRFYSALPEYVMSALETPSEFYGTVHGLRMLETRLSFHNLLYTSSYLLKCKYLIKILFSKYFQRKDFLRVRKYTVSRMKVIAVSHHTQFSISNYFSEIDPLQVKVFYSPSVADYDFDNDSLSEEFLSLGIKAGEYFLLVSGNRWIKNNLRAMMALDLVLTERKSVKKKIVITGVSNPSIFKRKLNNPKSFVFLDYVPENALNSLFSNAFAFVYSSLNEGFGYPPLEAMKYGRPVIASPLTSIPEICGDAALYANPYDIYEIKNRILQLCFDSETYNEYSNRGRQRYAFIYRRQERDLTRLVEYLIEPNN